MRIIHLSDLHIGKRLNEFSLIEDQEYILCKIIEIIDEKRPDAVIIAGDVYDKSVPSGEAVQLFDSFLCRLSERALKVFVISGNHDSPERIAFGSRLMEKSGIHMSPVYSGKVEPVVLEDEHGELCVYMLPFIKPAHVRRFFPEAEIESYTEALDVAISAMNVDTSRRNVLVTHQFVTGAQKSESEEISVGGSDNVDVCVFSDFDYVALGHIHGPQWIERETVRYCGTPLKYSFSEADHEKSVTVVDFLEKGNISIEKCPLVPLHDMREISGTYMELTSRDNYEGTATDDYMHITLTDEEDVYDAVGKLRAIYKNLMKLDYDNKRTRATVELSALESVEKKDPLELFCEFYRVQNGQDMTDEQREFSKELMERIWDRQ